MHSADSATEGHGCSDLLGVVLRFLQGLRPVAKILQGTSCGSCWEAGLQALLALTGLRPSQVDSAGSKEARHYPFPLSSIGIRVWVPASLLLHGSNADGTA